MVIHIVAVSYFFFEYFVSNALEVKAKGEKMLIVVRKSNITTIVDANCLTNRFIFSNPVYNFRYS